MVNFFSPPIHHRRAVLGPPLLSSIPPTAAIIGSVTFHIYAYHIYVFAVCRLPR